MTIFGWDASHYDATPNAPRIVSEGFKFMTHKAGGDANDGELASWWAAMKPVRGSVLLGAYWVLYPGNPSGRADAFLARLDSQCPGWQDGPFILQADCEIWGGDSSTRPGKADIKAFCDRLRVRAPKLMPIVYAPKWAYADSLSGLGYPLWASSYVTGSGSASSLYPGDGSSRWGSYSGQMPAILQFTSSATIAGQTTCDANAYRGTLSELTALVAPGWEADGLMAFIDDQAGFNAAMHAWASSAQGKTDIAYAVLGYDPDSVSDGALTWPAVADPWHPGQSMAPGSAIGAILTMLLSKDNPNDVAGPVNRIAELKTMIGQLTATVGSPSALAAAVAAALPAETGDFSEAQLTAAVEAGVRSAFAAAFSAS